MIAFKADYRRLAPGNGYLGENSGQLRTDHVFQLLLISIGVHVLNLFLLICVRDVEDVRDVEEKAGEYFWKSQETHCSQARESQD